MGQTRLPVKIAVYLIIFLYCLGPGMERGAVIMAKQSSVSDVPLPAPVTDGSFSIEAALQARRSVRSYEDRPLTLTEVGQLLWAAQGTTSARGFRTAPSAGALYPLELFVVVGDVIDLPAGVYRYHPDTHTLSQTADGDLRIDLSQAALGQRSLAMAPIVLVISAVYERTTAKYRDRGMRYVLMEAGHAAQNVYLQAVPLEIGTVVIGAFRDQQVQSLLNCGPNERPLYLMPLGKLPQ